MYPFYCKKGAVVRKTLQASKIYIPTLWPDVFDICSFDSLEYDYAISILPLPVDQEIYHRGFGIYDKALSGKAWRKTNVRKA